MSIHTLQNCETNRQISRLVVSANTREIIYNKTKSNDNSRCLIVSQDTIYNVLDITVSGWKNNDTRLTNRCVSTSFRIILLSNKLCFSFLSEKPTYYRVVIPCRKRRGSKIEISIFTENGLKLSTFYNSY